MTWKKCTAFLILVVYFANVVVAQGELNLQPDLGDDIDNTKPVINLQPNLGNDVLEKNQTLPKYCECVLFYQCKNGSVNRDGEGIFTIRKQDDSCPVITEVCCNTTRNPDATTPTSTTTTTSKPFTPATPPTPKGCGFRNPNGVSFKVTGNPENEAQFGEFPWVVAIMMKDGDNSFHPRPSCGGSLIHPLAVLTAAHCIKSNESYFIRVGEWDINNANEPFPHQDIEISSVSKFPQFYSGALLYDAAFVYLASPVTMHPHVNTICLPPKDFYMDAGRCYSSGWGKTEFGKKGAYSIVLKKVDLPQVSKDSCQDLLRATKLGPSFVLHSSFVCAGGEKGKDTCDGDGGSPLACPIEGQKDRFFQVGIVSWGIGCGEENIPGVYSNVALFRDWIDEEMFLHGLDYKPYEF